MIHLTRVESVIDGPVGGDGDLGGGGGGAMMRMGRSQVNRQRLFARLGT